MNKINITSCIVRRPIISFVILTYLISWSIWSLGYYLGDDKIGVPFLIIGGFGPAIAALTIERLNHSSELKLKLFNLKSSLPNYLLSVLIFPILFLILILFLVLFMGYPQPDFSQISLINLMFLIPVNILFGGALGEEIGWRGFLLVRLNEQYSNMISSIFVGVIWALWHLPLFLTDTYQNPMMQYLVIVILISFLFTFLLNRTINSIWPVVLLHASFNISIMLIGGLFPESEGVLEDDWNYFILLLIVIILFGYVLKSLKTSNNV